jgi:DNA invertase Pin-like site-specific DNA recombinase
MTPKRTPAVAYYRTSSAANVGEDKDSLKRQRDAVHGYAKRHKLEVTREFYDPAVSGADPVMERPNFAEMLGYLLANGARIVLVENASRFARDLAVQLAGHDLLKAKGITLIPVDAPNHFIEDTPTAVMVRNILATVSQFEKQSLVEKLRKARDRKSAELGKRIEGAHWVKEQAPPAEHVAAARAGKKRGLSLRKISAVLARKGFKNRSGKPYGAESIKLMLMKKPK